MVAVVTATTPVAAQSDRAREHFTAGSSLVEQGLFDDAYAEFAAGYGLSQRPLFLFNMGECARQAGRTETARRDYERYLAVDPDGSMADVARGRLEELPVVEPEVIAPENVASALPPEETQEPIVVVPNRRPRRIAIGVSAAVVAVIVALAVGLAARSDGGLQCSGDCEVADLR